jgi:ferredoxin
MVGARTVLEGCQGTGTTMPKITFTKENIELEVPEGAILRKECGRVSINTNQGVNGVGASVNKILNCFGNGMCGTCRVNIVKGAENCNSMTVREKLKFKYLPLPDPLPCMAYVGNEDTMRLACMVRVYGDIEVETGPELDLFGENFFS